MPRRFNQQQMTAGLQAPGQCLHGSWGRNGFVDYVKREHEVAGSFEVHEPEIFVRALAQLGTAGKPAFLQASTQSSQHTFLHVDAHKPSVRAQRLGDREGEESQRRAELEHAVLWFEQRQDNGGRVLEHASQRARQ
jgi:hypothetical protein